MYRSLGLLVLMAAVGGCATKPPATSTASSMEAAPTGAALAPPLIPREVLFDNPSRSSGQVSPDGRWLAYVAPRDGVLNLYIAPSDAPDQARPVTHDRGRGVRTFGFAYDGKHLLYPQDDGGDENFRIHAVNLLTGEDRVLTPAGSRAMIAKLTPKHPDAALVMVNDRDPQYFDPVRIDLASGRSERVFENSRFGDIMFDDDLAVRFAVQPTPDGGNTVHRRDGDDWQPWITIGADDALTTMPLGLTRDGSTLYMFDSRDRDTAALVSVDLATGDRRVLHEDARADVDDLLVDPRTGVIQAAGVNYLKTEWTVLDPAIADDLAYLSGLGEGEVMIASRTLADDRWVVAQMTAEHGTRYWRYDRARRHAEPWFHTRPALEQYTLAPMHAVEIPSRDGLRLVSYLTLPAESDADRDGIPAEPVPLVLWVHGGPWARDGFGFNSIHQWLANRGYAVLSVNFRSSTGFGKAFLNAGNLQWGRTMHDDLLDAVQWAIDRGITHADKVAIGGGSYGGYATLAGLAFTPDVFACGVDIVGPSNLVTLLESIPPYWGPMRAMFATRMGDPDTGEGRALLAERSPLHQAHRIRKPLLIGQGANDPRVKQAESDQIVQAMQSHGIPVTYVLYPDEGHGFQRPPNRLSFNAVTEAFLGRCLGGRVEPVGDAFDGATITVPHGAGFLPGLPEALAAKK
ncbi:S9 family peptidase [Pseudofulvimonas gallinarii]|jgi:dipeptidyl aminopeptidase/acylaminoacyl peptidase|uniref:Dipeptidyl aminopeptidase/acylaminoacyl peptidase n=1 Tax=Pseudofulvimonas gallinarii TaxID=634155 RepID=A0A4R3L3R5_9GAMM|nr:S9 family peptidase [Pseudofulvimonas gallinarii]TCS94361.1 dipeptidyl aminopeptidase/acylaminoacyl peptidase [Pseudofulvimonas gallinarii]THD14691.1 S9 family peptidase [Pseudofulvimonas gallinarii]